MLYFKQQQCYIFFCINLACKLIFFANSSLIISNLMEDGIAKVNIHILPLFQVDPSPQTTDSENLAHFSVTTALSYCKTKILKPYLRLLNITGLRSFSNDQSDSIRFVDCCSYLYLFALSLLMIAGYLLQYMACFRRDRGFGYVFLEGAGYTSERHHNIYEHICNDSLVFSYAIPHILHFMGYIYAFLIFRSSGDDQLPSLMETVSIIF